MIIAIFSGDIPSSAFIERLIHDLSNKDFQIYLFGKRKKKVNYNNNVKQIFFRQNRVIIVLALISELIKYLLGPFSVQKLKQLHCFARKEGNWAFYYQLLLVINNKPDVFHLQWIKEGHKWLILKDFNVKVAASFRGSHINYSPVADLALADKYRQTFPLYDGFHAVSQRIAQRAQEYNAPIENIKVIYTSVLNSEVTSPAISASDTKFRILSVGRSHWIKGYQYALESIADIVSDYKFVEYCIVGADPRDEELIYNVSNLGLQDFVKLIDTVPHHEMNNYYRSAKLLLLPSLDEGIANVVLEAMSQGLPVVCTDCGGMGEVIVNGENGFLVPIRDSKAITSAFRYFIEMEDKDRLWIAEQGRKTVLQKFSVERQIEEFKQFYTSFLK
ncbi:glycosyltransferase family 4 protein [Carboxylicivirga linearis]|uniref:Glycosyltransferase family 4 protein n=1 Tax=Carboxylicivirga linearis TaxID=1628157 RepID=A0ABS5JVZ2_9BACT|nr:glycosyltransferase family 4 protein [Carboxylicivirga linearis]MBS2099075.1 glycosyltransferase family 4 protein [Carboxylicivirga linearis]